MPEFEALVRRALAAQEQSESLAVDSERLRFLTAKLRQVYAGEGLLIRCAWCSRIEVDHEWLRLEAVTARQRQIAGFLIASASHSICPDCFDAHTKRRRH